MERGVHQGFELSTGARLLNELQSLQDILGSPPARTNPEMAAGMRVARQRVVAHKVQAAVDRQETAHRQGNRKCRTPSSWHCTMRDEALLACTPSANNWHVYKGNRTS